MALVANLTCRFFCRPPIPVAGDGRTRLRERQCNRSAQTAGRAGHQRGLSIQAKAIGHAVSPCAIPQQGTPYLIANRANMPFSEPVEDIVKRRVRESRARRRKGRGRFPRPDRAVYYRGFVYVVPFGINRAPSNFVPMAA
jgi:hypothetical protein